MKKSYGGKSAEEMIRAGIKCFKDNLNDDQEMRDILEEELAELQGVNP